MLFIGVKMQKITRFDHVNVIFVLLVATVLELATDNMIEPRFFLVFESFQ